ncbi:hypothetical protein RFI_20684, partial [Reticulomyxa filosa]
QNVPPFLQQDIDVLVSAPELSINTIKSSCLAFSNVMDSLRDLCDSKLTIANQYMIQMKEKAKRLSETKALFQKVESGEGDGKMTEDAEKLQSEMLQLQMELYQLDEEYRPIHSKLRQINKIENDLEKFRDNYMLSMSQLRRVHRRIGQVLHEHQTQCDSTIIAFQATDVQQGVIQSEIKDKMIEFDVHIQHLEQRQDEARNERIANQSYATTIARTYYSSYFSTADAEQQFEQGQKSTKELELESELDSCKNSASGLSQFLRDLQQLRREQTLRITYLQQVIEQLNRQKQAVQESMDTLQRQAVHKLQTIRVECIAPLQEQLLLLRRDDPSHSLLKPLDSEEKREGISNDTELSLEQIAEKRARRMNQVHAKLRDLESRAMTIDSGEYLRGLTEVRELQLIMSNPYLKFFFTDFVRKTNQMFQDMQLAATLISQQTPSLFFNNIFVCVCVC